MSLNASGHYITVAELITRWGDSNIRQWADKDNDGDETKLSASIQDAIDTGEARIDLFFRGSAFATPLSPANATVKDWAKSICGAVLYQMRGMRDGEDALGGQLAEAERRAFEEMRYYRGNPVQGPWGRYYVQASAPITHLPGSFGSDRR